jgi:hypothetical protein
MVMTFTASEMIVAIVSLVSLVAVELKRSRFRRRERDHRGVSGFRIDIEHASRLVAREVGRIDVRTHAL